MTMLSFEGKEIETDNEGYLKESAQWSEALAEVMLKKRRLLSPPNTGSGAFCPRILS